MAPPEDRRRRWRWRAQPWRGTAPRSEPAPDKFKITVALTREEAAALLRFLRRVDVQDKEFEHASKRLRIVIRDAIDPDWREELNFYSA